jgi:hypothetical protein
MAQPPLLACPTCGTAVEDANLGLRDYSRWLTPVLPGQLGATDLDLVLDQAKTGRILVIEFKEANKRLGLGQRLLFKRLVQRGFDVWVVWQYSNKEVMVGAVDSTGNVRFLEKMSEAKLAQRVKNWWYDGLEEQQQ